MKSSKYLIVLLFAGLFLACNCDDQLPANAATPDKAEISTDGLKPATIANKDNNVPTEATIKVDNSTVDPDTTTTTPPTTTPTVAPDTTTTLAPNTTTTVAPNTTTTVAPNTTTTVAPETTTVAPDTTTTLAPNTTTTVAPNTTTTMAPNTTTTVAPITSTTPAPIQPCHRFDGPSFIGGIVLTLGLLAIGMVAYKFYKARNERNYQTL